MHSYGQYSSQQGSTGTTVRPRQPAVARLRSHHVSMLSSGGHTIEFFTLDDAACDEEEEEDECDAASSVGSSACSNLSGRTLDTDTTPEQEAHHEARRDAAMRSLHTRYFASSGGGLGGRRPSRLELLRHLAHPSEWEAEGCDEAATAETLPPLSRVEGDLLMEGSLQRMHSGGRQLQQVSLAQKMP